MLSINRDEELTQLYDLVMARTNMLMYAEESMGKTFLLNELQKKLAGRRICFYIDLSGIDNLADYVRQLTYSIKKTAASFPNVDYQLRTFFDHHPTSGVMDIDTYHTWLEQLLIALQGISQDFLFIADHYNQFELKDNGLDLFLRICDARNSHLLICNTAELKHESLQNWELPALQLHHFKQSHLEELAEILKYSRGNTGFTLDILQQTDGDTSQWKNAIPILMAQYRPFFITFRLRFTPLQWKLIKAIAKEEMVGQPHAFEFLLKYQLGAASSIERALQNLQNSGIIVRTTSGYQHSNIRFQKWLAFQYS